MRDMPRKDRMLSAQASVVELLGRFLALERQVRAENTAAAVDQMACPAASCTSAFAWLMYSIPLVSRSYR